MKLFTALACLCMLFACSKSDDERTAPASQNSLKSGDVNGNASQIIYVDWPYFEVNVECDGVIDVLTGSWTAHVVIKYKDGVEFSEIQHWYGEFTSTNTGEIFKFTRKDVADFGPPPDYVTTTWTSHVNLIGNLGTHYIARFDLNPDTQGLQLIKVVCPGNNK